MKKYKNTLVMLLVSCAMVVALFATAYLMILDGAEVEENNDNIDIVVEDLTKTEPWLLTNPSDQGVDLAQAEEIDNISDTDFDEEIEESIDEPVEEPIVDASVNIAGAYSDKNSLEIWEESQLIYDCTEIDYYAYVQEPVIDSKIEVALDIINPDIEVVADAAILIDADTKEVLFHKNACKPLFPASTSKLLSSLVTLEWCQEDEEVIVGEEVNYIAADSSKANIREGQILTIRNLIEGMLLPSGNDAAYVVAAYVGRKSLEDLDASGELAVGEFVRLMNEKAESLGAINSHFKTPDGYDAIGQYTTAYDIGLIGLASAENETILEISNKASSRNMFPSGEDITWRNSNALVNENSGRYYPYADGLKTGTSTMAGKCLVSHASKDSKNLICVVLSSTSAGRYDDTITLLDYGLQ